jgi:hypothetical protein
MRDHFNHFTSNYHLADSIFILLVYGEVLPTLIENCHIVWFTVEDYKKKKKNKQNLNLF